VSEEHDVSEQDMSEDHPTEVIHGSPPEEPASVVDPALEYPLPAGAITTPSRRPEVFTQRVRIELDLEVRALSPAELQEAVDATFAAIVAAVPPWQVVALRRRRLRRGPR
jgi:hypothetical protein